LRLHAFRARKLCGRGWPLPGKTSQNDHFRPGKLLRSEGRAYAAHEQPNGLAEISDSGIKEFWLHKPRVPE